MKNTILEQQLNKDAVAVTLAIRSELARFSDPLLAELVRAEEYSLLAGGKRIRPILTLAFCRLFGGSEEAAMPYAVAVEMIHTASLIHDDLPAIDDDELRRGKPTSHVVFGEATAILAADALFMDAFGLVAGNALVSHENTRSAVKALSFATGTEGLVGGEFMDVAGEGGTASLEELRVMHARKTGALIKLSATLGALAAGVSEDDERMRDVKQYAENIGLAFQIVDDVLDAVGTEAELGKKVGSDIKEKKTTYLSFYTPDEALTYAEELTALARAALEKYDGSEFLSELAYYLSKRRK